MLAVAAEAGGRGRKLPGLEAERIVSVLRRLRLRLELLSRLSLGNAPQLLASPHLSPEVAAALAAHHAAERALLAHGAPGENERQPGEAAEQRALRVLALQRTAREALRLIELDPVQVRALYSTVGGEGGGSEAGKAGSLVLTPARLCSGSTLERADTHTHT